MSEADNPTNTAFSEPMNSVNSTDSEQANPFFSNSPDQTIAPVNVPESQGENPQFFDFPALSSSVEATENGMSAIAPSQRVELVNLIQELRSSNSNLLKRVLQLEQALTECQKALQLHKQQLREAHVTESMLTQQTQEMAAAQEQVRCLLQELEASHQTTQRQQILIETLTTQLESSQERVAQLERECSLIQASYNEQSYQLVQSENTSRELRTRLTRQQRQTMQFKLALEKSLEATVPSYQSQADTDAFSPVTTRPPHDLRNKPTEPPFFPKAQSIPPWSAQPQSLTNELEPAWESPLWPTPPITRAKSSAASPFPEFAQTSILDWSTEDLSTPQETEPIAALETDDPPLLEEALLVVTFSQQPPEAVSPLEQTFEEQQDLLIDLLFEAPSAESSEPTTDLEELYSSTEDTSEADEEAYWQDLFNLFEAGSEPVTASSPQGTTVANPAVHPPAQLDDPHLLDTGSEQVSPDYTTQFQPTSPPQQETSSLTPNSHWPSPVVYPLRPPKGRKTLAAIELPTFVSISDQSSKDGS